MILLYCEFVVYTDDRTIVLLDLFEGIVHIVPSMFIAKSVLVDRFADMVTISILSIAVLQKYVVIMLDVAIRPSDSSSRKFPGVAMRHIA